ncbi:type II toxin-antitoxin system VapC family toxin [Paracraurococcus lichenis]|uniref:Ribonuclease VapC n=1 Tax=Paracraurococcus lichenis TaxID=3064888 RepID=A0ABT9E114_9PROT|nr:type II toxin-antitoxin system VapC family toxin [Paracraurococcus sp. LOR1-02]MDO9709819.1 type II toxin-antitoxin system VapC family toxin [Paracraurococcus sp. LOR1-02]
MIVDTSAVMAIVRKEPEAKDFNALLSERQGAVISAATLVELTMVAEGRGDEFAWAEVEALLAQAGIEVVAFTPDQARIAQDGWRRFGKGRHPAALNLGDCFAYALAKQRGEPLLFKGDDFSKTDVKAAI